MKAQTRIISPLGTFTSNLQEITQEEVDEMNKFLENIHRLSHVAIQRENETIYFPAEVIQKSIVSFIVIKE